MINKQIHIPQVYEPENVEENSLDSYKITGVSIRHFTDQEMELLKQQITELANKFEISDPNLRNQYISKVNIELEIVLQPKIKILLNISNQGKKILLPYIADKPTAILSKDENMLFYCGYAVFANTDKELLILKKILTSDVFWNYIQNTSKSYSKGYKALAKNYIKDFGIPEFNEADEKFLLTTSNKNKINEFLYSKYSA